MARVQLILLGVLLGCTPLAAQSHLSLSSGYSFLADWTVGPNTPQAATSTVLSNAFDLRAAVLASDNDFGVAFGFRLSQPAALYFSSGGAVSSMPLALVGEMITSSFQLGAGWRHELGERVGLQLSGGLGLHTREIKRDPGTVNYRTVFVLTPQLWSEYRLSFLIEEGISLYWAGNLALGLWRFSETASRAGVFHSWQDDQLLIEFAPSLGLTAVF